MTKSFYINGGAVSKKYNKYENRHCNMFANVVLLLLRYAMSDETLASAMIGIAQRFVRKWNWNK